MLRTKKQAGRIIAVRPGDRLVYKGWEIDLAVLDVVITSGNKRLLWRFTRQGSRIQPVVLTEKQVIWLDDEGKEG
jgi:hypothetical protein